MEKQMNQYSFSRFYHKYSKDDQICCYNALTMGTVYTNQKAYQELEQNLSEENPNIRNLPLYQQLIDEHILVEKHFDTKLLETVRCSAFHGVSIRVMVLHMTDFCNLKCKYCFVEGGQPEGYQRKVMDLDTAKAAVEKFIHILKKGNNTHNHPTIVFYGGEPLLNWSVIQELLPYIQEVEVRDNLRLDKVIITNGTLMTEEMAEVIQANNILVSVSIDGIQEVHDANRVDYANKGSFSRAVQSIRTLQLKGVSPAVSCVMAKEGLPHCESSVQFLIEKLNIQGLGFNHVSIIPGLNFYDPDYEEHFADAMIRVQELIQEKYPHVYERRMGHKVNTFIDKQLIKSDCTGCGEQISVSPLGEIGICQGYMGSRKTFTHTVFENNYFPDEDEIFQEWSTRSPLNIQECLDCPALATCGGGCPRNADMLHGSIWNIDSAFCHFARKAQEWLVWQEITE